MNRDTVIGFILIGIILIVFSVINRPGPDEIEAAKKRQTMRDSIARQEERSASDSLQHVASVPDLPPPEETDTALSDSLRNIAIRSKYREFYEAAQEKPGRL